MSLQILLNPSGIKLVENSRMLSFFEICHFLLETNFIITLSIFLVAWNPLSNGPFSYEIEI